MIKKETIPVSAEVATRAERASARILAKEEVLELELELVFLLAMIYVSFQKIIFYLSERPLRGSLSF